MTVVRPLDMPEDRLRSVLQDEQNYSMRLQEAGKWKHIWRVVGQHANLSIFDVTDNGELHELLWNLPLRAYLRLDVTPLSRHGSDRSVSADGDDG